MKELSVDYTTFKQVIYNTNGTGYYVQETSSPDGYYALIILKDFIITTLITNSSEISNFFSTISSNCSLASSKNAALALAISSDYAHNLYNDSGLKILYDTTTDVNTVYIGTAPVGSLSSSAVWSIKKISLLSGNPVDTKWSSKKAIWDNRLIENYN